MKLHEASSREQMIAAVTDRIIEKLRCLHSAILVVGVDGRACSGKTELTRELCSKLNGRSYVALSMAIDDFCNPRSIRYSAAEPEALQVYERNFDLNRFRDTIMRMRERSPQNVAYDVFNVRQDRITESRSMDAESADILICEGIHLLRSELRSLFHFGIFLEIEPDEQVRRAYSRDPGRGNTPEDIAYKYRERYNPSFDHHIRRNDPAGSADIVIDNNNILNPRIKK